MIAEMGQAASQAASSGAYITGTFALDAAVIIGGIELVKLAVRKLRGGSKNGNGGPKPGEAEICRIRGERMTKAETKVESIEGTLSRYEGYFQDILRRLPK